MIDKELIEDWRRTLKPVVSSWLYNINYEQMGEQDKEEFERDFDEILDLALIGLEQPEIIYCKDCIKGKYHNLAKSTMCMLHPFNPVRVEPDGFCKWAERRTDD